MAGISKINNDYFTNLAAKENKNIVSLNLKDDTTAKLLWNNEAVDCFILNQEGRMSEAYGHRGAPAQELFVTFAKITDRLKELIEPGQNIIDECYDALRRKY